MNQVQFIGTTPQDLISKFAEQLIPQLVEELVKKVQSKTAVEYLTPEEVCNLLRIDKSTLWRWKKKGTLTARNLEGCVYYLRSEIDELLNPKNAENGK